jgi:3-(3-hydroxy-phenyl)propionate hydroxylase
VPRPEVLVDGRPCRLDDVLGPGPAELTSDLVVRRADGTHVQLVDPSGTLTRWLRHGQASAVRIRPDRIVRSAVTTRRSCANPPIRGR